MENLSGPRDKAKRLLRSFTNNRFTQPDQPTSSNSTAPRPIPRSDRASLVSQSNSRRWTWPTPVETRRSPCSQSSKIAIDSVVRSVLEEKPLASGNGINISIFLTEPVLFIQGFKETHISERSTAMLRGSLKLRVTKPTKIKLINLNFHGKTVTKWPNGTPPKNLKFEETDTIMNHTWLFFDAQFPTATARTGADYAELFQSSLGGVLTQNGLLGSLASSSTNMNSEETNSLLLQTNPSQGFVKGDLSINGPSVAQKRYRTFKPGDYMYNFELPLNSSLPETIDVEFGSVKYELKATIARAGAFRVSLVGIKEVTLIRTPVEGSLEQVEPIVFSRSWENQLRYDIVIFGKSFPLAAQIPIAFKLTPLAKGQCHCIKVFATENIDFYCLNKRVHRMEPVQKVQLFEKRVDGPPISTFPGCFMRIVSGGATPYDQRAAATKSEGVQVQEPTEFLSGSSGDVNIGPTEMEFNVQLPSCHNLKHNGKLSRLHFDTTYRNIQIRHHIRIVLRFSKPDKLDPNKRRHSEITIDLPLPLEPVGDVWVHECGCPGAPVRHASPPRFVPTLDTLTRSRGDLDATLPSTTITGLQQDQDEGPLPPPETPP